MTRPLPAGRGSRPALIPYEYSDTSTRADARAGRTAWIEGAALAWLRQDSRRAITEDGVDPTLRARGGARLRAYEERLRRRENGRQVGPLRPRDAGGRFIAAAPATS